MMRKLLTSSLSIASITSLLLGGCGSLSDLSVGDPITGWLEESSLIYRPDVQQGNVVTQDMVNRLKPGMAKRQVRFLLGTPMVTDPFHKDRWDYPYLMRVNGEETEERKLSVYFQDERLVRIAGDLRPQAGDATDARKEVNVEVPDYVAPNRPIFDRVLGTVGIDRVEN